MAKRAAILVLLALTAVVSDAAAQTRVRVTEDATTVWRANFLTIETVVSAGTVLEVLGRRGEFYEVVVPPSSGKPRLVGFVAVTRLQYLDGPPLPAAQPSTARGTQTRPVSRPVGARGAAPKTGLRGFGELGYGRFAAKQSFDAVLGQPGGVWFGGGAEFRLGPLFVDGRAERFRRTGERVFVDGGEVFKLGIPDTITVVPITFTGGYRKVRNRLSPYVGAGVGQYRYKEESSLALPSENFSQRSTSYHVLGGLEWRDASLFAAAVEFQYTAVPDALNAGVSAAFDEHDLGGFQIRVKILVGR
jgi:opacity protein-like surface antigen